MGMVKKEHLKELEINNGECLFDDEAMKRIEEQPYTITIKSHGKVLCCGGVNVYWENRGEFWMVIASNCGPKFLTVHRAMVKFLDSCSVRRIEAATGTDNTAMPKWAKLLGFKKEASNLKAYYPNGMSADLYARIQPCLN